MADNPFTDPALVAVWTAAAARRAETLAATNQMLLDRAGVGDGSRVLDLGTGTGDTALIAAARVGAGGHVLAIDPSAAMLEEARKAVAAAGLTNIELRRAGAGEVHEGGFDAVISRMSLQFLPDLPAGLQWARSCLRPGGRLAAVVGSRWREDPFMSIPLLALEAIGRPAKDGDPILVPFSLGDPDRLQSLVVAAGFSSVVVERTPLLRTYADPGELWSAVQSMPQTKRALAGLPPELQAGFMAALKAAAAALGAAGPIQLHSSLLLVSGGA